MSLEKEINVDFKRSINKIKFDKVVTNNPQTFGFVTIPPPATRRTPAGARVEDMPYYDYNALFDNLCFISLLHRREAIEGLNKVRFECNKVAAMSLFQIPNKHMKLEEFEQAQTQQTFQVRLNS